MAVVRPTGALTVAPSPVGLLDHSDVRAGSEIRPKPDANRTELGLRYHGPRYRTTAQQELAAVHLLFSTLWRSARRSPGDDSPKNGIPWALIQKDFVLDGQTIPNPLRSFVLNQNIKDNVSGTDPDYSKPKGYETVRHPLSGLVESEKERAPTKAHNYRYPSYEQNATRLNKNVVAWLTSSIAVKGKTIPTHTKSKFMACQNAPNYTVFSNTTSAGRWNTDLDSGAVQVVPLETPHNDNHLAVGGCDVLGQDDSPIEGANADISGNDTVGLDPIFFFHHCVIEKATGKETCEAQKRSRDEVVTVDLTGHPVHSVLQCDLPHCNPVLQRTTIGYVLQYYHPHSRRNNQLRRAPPSRSAARSEAGRGSCG